MKISAKDFEAAGGDLFKVKDKKGRTIEDVYAGGTAEGLTTTSAKMGTILGVFSTALSKAGEKMDEKLGPTLDRIIGYAEKLEPALGDFLAQFGEAAVNGIAGFLDNLIAAKDELAPYAPLLKGIAELAGGLLFGALKIVGGLFVNVLIPLLGWIGDAFGPALKALGDLFSEMGQAARDAGNMLVGALTKVKDAFHNFRPGDLWELIKSWFTGKSSLDAGAFKGWSGHAAGGYASGATVINDAGGDRYAEALRLPNGSMVFPAGATRRMIAKEIKAAGGRGGANNVYMTVDARGSNMSPQERYRFRRSLVRELLEALDNVAPA